MAENRRVNLSRKAEAILTGRNGSDSEAPSKRSGSRNCLCNLMLYSTKERTWFLRKRKILTRNTIAYNRDGSFRLDRIVNLHKESKLIYVVCLLLYRVKGKNCTGGKVPLLSVAVCDIVAVSEAVAGREVSTCRVLFCAWDAEDRPTAFGLYFTS